MDHVIGRWCEVLPSGLQRQIERLRTSPLASRLIRGSLWSLTGSAVSRALGLVATVFAARILGKSSYGELGIILSTVGMFGNLAGFGMGTTATKCVAELRLKDPDRAGRVIGLSAIVSWTMSTLLSLSLVVAAPWLSEHVLSAPHITHLFQLGGVLLFLSGVNGAQNGALAGFEAFQTTARVSATTGLLNLPLVVGGAYFFGLGGVVGGLILAQAVGCFMNFLAVREEARRHQVRISYSSLKSELPVIWEFSIPAVLGILLISPMTWVCNAMLVRQPHGYSHMGALNAATQWYGALTLLPYTLSGVMLSILSERLGAADGVGSSRLLKASIMGNALIVVPLAAIGSLLSPLIMGAYGPDFRGEWPTMVAMLLVACAASIQIPVGVTIAASSRMWTGFLLNLGWSAVLLSATWVLVQWGAFGVALAQLLAYTAQGLGAYAVAGHVVRGDKAGAADV